MLLPHVTNGFGQSGLVAPITSAATKLKVLQHPHVAVYRIAQNSQVMSIGGRDAPGLDTALLLPHWAGLTFQVDVKQRRAPGRRTGNVEPLPVQRPAHSAKTIPSRHDQVARRAASQWQQADSVLSGQELRGDLGAIGRKVPVILEAGMGRDPGNLTASAL